MKHLTVAITTAWAAILVPLSSAATTRLSPGNPGAISNAITAASPGDTLILEPGVYHENIRIDKKLTLRGEPGAILDGTTPMTARWSPAGDLENTYVTDLGKLPYGLLSDGKFLPEIRYDRAKKDGPLNWRTLFAKGMPLAGYTRIRALWMYHPEERKIYLRFGTGTAPENASLSLVPAEGPLLEIKGPGVTVEGLTLRGGKTGIKLDAAVGSVIRRCTITSFENTGILITSGSSDCTVEECSITRGSFEEWSPVLEKGREGYEIWQLHKQVGRYDRIGINLLRAGTNNRILRNRLDRVFDGINIGDPGVESLDKPLIDPDHGRGTEIAHNTIEHTRDSGIELGVGCIDVEVHHNTLRQTHGGLRFKLPRIGPVFIHHNHLIDGEPFNIWFSMDSSPAEGYIYHNTIERGGDAAITYSSFNALRDFATPKWHYINNLAISPRGGPFRHGRGTPPRDFIDSNNIVTKDPDAAIDAGKDLSTYYHGKPLPGYDKTTIKGKAPDAGADER